MGQICIFLTFLEAANSAAASGVYSQAKPAAETFTTQPIRTNDGNVPGERLALLLYQLRGASTVRYLGNRHFCRLSRDKNPGDLSEWCLVILPDARLQTKL